MPVLKIEDPAIRVLELEPDVAAKALVLKVRCPGVVFTSGRRSIPQQARAMARNTLSQRNFIAETYADCAAKRALVAWLEAHPHTRTLPQIAAGFEAVLNALPAAELLHISRHLTGRAFDVKPGSCTQEAALALRPEKFLTREAGLARWHLQF